MENHLNNQKSKELLEGLSFCVFDLETTGGNKQKDKIIEIGLVKIVGLQIIEEKNILINPEIKIPEFIQKLTNIHQHDVKDSPLIEDVIDEVIKFMGESILVAHNTSFDVPFFNSVLGRLDRPILQNRSICTHLMTKYLIPCLLSSNLTYMSKLFDIEHEKAHRALDDAKATAELLIKYLYIFIDKGISKVNHLYYPRNRFELDRFNLHNSKDITGEHIVKKLEEISGPHLVTIKGENGVILFSIPCSGDGSEISFIMDNLKDKEWSVFTVQLFGHFLETLIHHNNFISKMPSDVKESIVDFLYNKHIPRDHSKKDLDKIGDFIIVNHLVPDQYTIYSLSILTPSASLVFRYPAHKKKMLQFINSKSKKNQHQKHINSQVDPDLHQFILSQLSSFQRDLSDVFIFNKNLPLKNRAFFDQNIEAFIKRNPQSCDFPKVFI